MTYTTTHTGRQVARDSGEPALLDIALGLSRIARFAGQGKQFFSVMAHTLWMEDYYRSGAAGLEVFNSVRAAILLHDASEVAVSDIPSPMKTYEQKQLGYALDARIFNRYFAGYGGYERYADRSHPVLNIVDVVKNLDWTCLLAEYWSVGPAHPCYLEQPAESAKKFFAEWIRKNHVYMMPSYAPGDSKANGPVVEYMDRISRLL